MEKVKLILHQHKNTYSDFEYYHLHIEKIENNKSKNPDIAIESCKSLIEGVSKSVLNRLDITFDEKKESSGKNPRSVQWFFKKSLEKIAEKSEEFEASFVASSGQIINIISEIRTKRGDISHGKSVPKLVESSPEFAEMVTNMTDLIVSYTLKHFFQIDTTDKDKLDYFPKDEENPTEDEETIIKYNTYLDESQPDFPISTTSYSQLLYENDYDEYETRFYDEFLKTLQPEEDSDETEKEEPKIIVEVSNPRIEHLVKEFFADVFWTDERNAELTVFAEKENLKEAELKQVINFYLDEEKEPFPDSIKETMIDRPSLLEFRKIKKELTQKIIEFAKSLNNETK
ncbi:hypothetical protein [Tenacibaculum sp. SDUM215027]|uniref:hypothetical protein n=1 Tax=Tenacibaculum sp. SDUM215027 TaxID=3422596 RepID=UPI003D311B0E